MADEMTPRERRKARASKSRGFDASKLRKLVVPLLIIGVLAVIVSAMVYRENADSRCPGHWHSTFSIVVDGERVTFAQPPYSLSGEGGDLPISMHMHRGNDQLLHFEPTTRDACRSVASTFRMLGVNLFENSMEIEDAGHNIAGTFRDNETNPLRAFIGQTGDDGEPEWDEVSWGDFVDRGQLRDRTRVLILSGTYTDEEVTSLQAAVPSPFG